jgi:hypothetical protein
MSETKGSDVSRSSGSGGNVGRSDNDNNWRRAGSSSGDGRGNANSSTSYKGSNNTSRGRGGGARGGDRFGAGEGNGNSNSNNSRDSSGNRRVGSGGDGRGGDSGRKSATSSGRGPNDSRNYNSGRGREFGSGRGRGGGRFDSKGRIGNVTPNTERPKIPQNSSTNGSSETTSKLEILKKTGTTSTEGGDDKIKVDVEAKTPQLVSTTDNTELGTESTSDQQQETSGAEVEVKKREMKKREPDVVNTRAAALGVPGGEGKREVRLEFLPFSVLHPTTLTF